jgi:hypothetical protein
VIHDAQQDKGGLLFEGLQDLIRQLRVFDLILNIGVFDNVAQVARDVWQDLCKEVPQVKALLREYLQLWLDLCIAI